MNDLTELPQYSTHTSDPKLDELFTAYKTNPALETKKAVVDHLAPTIEYQLGQLGSQKNPGMRAHLKVITSKSLDKYDPEKNVPLPAFLSSQYRQAYREKRTYDFPVDMPEREVYDYAKLKQAENTFLEDTGREPDLLELADFTGTPLKRIKAIRGRQRYLTKGQYSQNNTTEEGGVALPFNENNRKLDDALDYVYHDLDHKERKIMEGITGYGTENGTTRSTKELMEMLNLSQSQISRLSAKIMLKIKETVEFLEKQKE